MIPSLVSLRTPSQSLPPDTCLPPTHQTHIARLLSAATTLRTLRLNLDFHEDHQAYCAHRGKRDAWLKLFRDERGPEIVEIVAEACPRLEHVALLYHGWEGATWAEFHPQRCAEPRFVLDYTREHLYVPVCPCLPRIRVRSADVRHVCRDQEPCIREWESE